MIKNFSEYKLNEEEVPNDYIKELLSQIKSLEDKNSDLVDRIDELEDDIKDLEKTVDEKDDEIYGLEDSYSKLEKENSKFESEIESWKKQEEKWIDEKQDLEAQLKIFQDPYTIFNKGTEDEKTKVVEAFLDMLDIMEDRPIEFGSMLRKEMKTLTRIKRLINSMLNKEWVDAYTGSGGSLLNNFDIKD
jgi:chromosome segregation ATPase